MLNVRKIMEEAKKIVGKDLRKLAEEKNIEVFVNGKKNKGWAGHVIEKHLGLELNSRQEPDFGDIEIKVIPLKYKGDRLVVKETMAVTMINPEEIVKVPFEESHLFYKVNNMIIFARIWLGKNEESSPLYGVFHIDLNESYIFEKIKNDYDYIQHVVRQYGFNHLSGRMGEVVQPRTKGSKERKGRAFYIRKQFLETMLKESSLTIVSS